MTPSLYYERHDLIRFKNKIHEMVIEEVSGSIFPSDSVIAQMQRTRALEIFTVAVGILHAENAGHTRGDLCRQQAVARFKYELKQLIDDDVANGVRRLGRDMKGTVRRYAVGLLLQAVAELTAEYDKEM